LAHPDLFDSYDILDELIPVGLDGVEVWHPLCPKEKQDYLIDVAARHDLLMTGGSDFHGMYTMAGVSIGDVTVPEENVRQLLNYKSRRKQ
jgi:hypothetical protein